MFVFRAVTRLLRRTKDGCGRGAPVICSGLPRMIAAIRSLNSLVYVRLNISQRSNILPRYAAYFKGVQPNHVYDVRPCKDHRGVELNRLKQRCTFTLVDFHGKAKI